MLVRPSALLRASHPIPCVAVTALSSALFAIAGKPPGVCLLGAAAVLAGQLSIGWSNDLIDAQRDRAAGRRDKPLALEPELAGQLRLALGVAVVLAVSLSLALGWRAAALHAVTVAGGWAYNLGLKATPWSALAYFLAFAALPAIATAATPGPTSAPAWTMLAAGLVGVAAHFGNVLPDLPQDVAAGVLGLPQRLGVRGSALAAVTALLVAAGLIDTQAGFRHPVLSAIGTALVLVLALVVLGYALRRPRSQGAFLATIAAAAVDVVILAVNRGLG